ncbi:hypothetical protein [Sphingomonas mucosissima]|uniref:Uncharacterized protein n=1 Tax=Sphingomonas mucosissima TaxID=370959 RepID=A0A245ZEP0_9SPHN|nr:hypothetical protein [Sphingomonas mucosissima]OWK28179.1 hypothetical protein SPMU_30350 [Sphingomonas mucosissima]
MHRRLTVAAAFLMLAACNAPEQQSEAAVNDGALAAGANTADVVANAASTPEPVADRRIPSAFLGRWGLVPADCTSTMGDNKGLMTVTPDRLTFYESRAAIARLEALSPTELRASLAFTGEGQEWTQETPLILEENGRVLVRVAEGERLRYTRCDA